jgi:hypothetical protein
MIGGKRTDADAPSETWSHLQVFNAREALPQSGSTVPALSSWLAILTHQGGSRASGLSLELAAVKTCPGSAVRTCSSQKTPS